MNRRWTPQTLLLAAAVLVVMDPAWASSTAGQIKGSVTDESGISIPGALVTIKSPSLIGGAQQRSTDDEGNFQFAELSPGAYEVLTQLQGFAPVRMTGVEVQVSRTTNVNVVLKTGSITVDVVGAKPTVDVEQVSNTTTMNSDFLSRIPTGRSYQDAVGQAAGVLSGGNPSAGGAAGNENTIILDGVNTTDPVTGTFSMNFNYDAIDQISVTTGGFDPEYGESLGALIQIVTKSGGNTLQINAGGYYGNGNWSPKMDARFGADGYPLAPTGFDESSQTAEADLVVSGPIVKDKLWYLASYQYQRTLYSNVGVQLPRDFDAHYILAKLTAQPTSKHRVTLQFSTDPTTVDNIDQDNTRERPEAQGRQAQGGYIASAKWNWFINKDTNLETTASYQKSYIEVGGVPCTKDLRLGYNPCEPDELENRIDYQTPGRYGFSGAYASENNGTYYFDDRFRIQGSTKLSVLEVRDPLGGKHDLKGGIDFSYLKWDQVQGYNGNLYFYDIYENPFDPATLKNYYWIETSGAYEYSADGYHIGAFLQDAYKPVENLTFRYGIRYDRALTNNDAGEAIVDVGVWGPRVYGVWDPFNDQKTRVYGGYGRFNDTSRLSVASYLSQSNLGSKLIVGELFGNNTSNTANMYAESGTENTISVFDNTTAPHSDELSAGVEREVIKDIAAGIDFTGKFTRNVYTFDETNLIYDEDGYAYLGSRDGSLDLFYRLRTPELAQRNYYQTDFSISRSFTKRWQLFGTYSYVVSQGRTQGSLSGALVNPQQLDLGYGNLGSDVRHQVKLAASWDLPDDPWTTRLGMSGTFFSGYPLSRYYYSSAGLGGGADYTLLKERMGTYGRTSPYWEVAVKVEQQIPVKQGKLSAVLTVNNVTNNNYPTVYYTTYIDTQNRYLIAYRQDPVSAQVGAKYEF